MSRGQLDRCAGRLEGKLRRAGRRWQVVPEGAHTAIGISGGWDSLALALLLNRQNSSLRRPLVLRGLHVRLSSEGITRGLDPQLRSWCESIGLRVEEIDPRLDAAEELPLGCYRCAGIRRRTLLEAACERGCTHLALGHHADDVVDTWLLSLFYTGTADTMPPLRSYFGGAVTLIRPLYEIQRRELIRLGRLAGFPEPQADCARDDDLKRHRVAEALRAMGRDEWQVRRRLFWAAVRQLEAAGQVHGEREDDGG